MAILLGREKERLLQKDALWRAYILDQKSSLLIGREIGVHAATVRNRLKLLSIPVRPGGPAKSYPFVDTRKWESVDSDQCAYWLGFLAADGAVRNDKRDSLLKVKLSGKDRDHLELLRDALGCAQQIKETSYGGYTQASLCVNDRSLVQVLCSWGITPNKTLRLKLPDRLHLALRRSWVRGFFDGDGTMMIRDRGTYVEAECRFTSGSEPFLRVLADLLSNEGILTRHIYRQGQATYVLPLSSAKHNVRAFAEYIYSTASVWLPRKRELLERV